MSPRPIPRIGYANTRSFDDSHSFGSGRRGNVETVTEQIMGVETLVDAHRAAEQTGALGPALDISHRLDRAQQDSSGVAFAFRDDVHAVVHPINEVDVSMPRRTKHDFGSLSQPLGRMGSQ